MTQIERYLTLIIRPETKAFEAFSKVEVLMFFGKRALRANLLILLAKLKTRLLTSVLIFLVLARRRTSKSELLKQLSFQAWQSTSDIARFESYLQESKALDKLNKLRNFVCCKTTSMSRVQHVRSGVFFYPRGVSSGCVHVSKGVSPYPHP